MGTDIHLYVEKRHTGGEWYCDSVENDQGLFIWRDYSVFDTLCGVRGPVESVTERIAEEPRGFPTDVANQTRELINGHGAGLHSISWCSWPEFTFYFPWRHNRHDMSHFAKVAWTFENPWGDSQDFVRFVFGFDS